MNQIIDPNEAIATGYLAGLLMCLPRLPDGRVIAEVEPISEGFDELRVRFPDLLGSYYRLTVRQESGADTQTADPTDRAAAIIDMLALAGGVLAQNAAYMNRDGLLGDRDVWDARLAQWQTAVIVAHEFRTEP